MPKTCPVCGTTYPDGNAFCPADGTTLRADELSQDIIGTVIADRYLVSELLGEGGMGRVYLARHVRLPQQAAIKVLHPGMVTDSAAVARFNREAANAARIEHERVARVFDFGETSTGLVYLAMEYVPGRTLRALADASGRIAVGRAANIVFQIAEGLEAAHRIGIVHRDLKPDNILVVTDEQGSDRCKVVDFGIAKAVDSGGQTQLTQAGMLVGTPEFMSPEQVVGEALDGRSDVYALALVAFQAFTGVLPFNANSPERSLTARLIDDPRTLSDAAPDIAWPAELQSAFDRALQREPADRTPSAIAFADAVVTAVESWTGISVLRPRTPMSTPALTLAANEIAAASLTPPTVRTVAAAGVSGGTPRVNTSMSPASHAAIPEATRKRTSPLAVAATIGGLLIAGGGTFYALQGNAAAPGAAPGRTAEASAVGNLSAPGGQNMTRSGDSGGRVVPAANRSLPMLGAKPVAGAGAPASDSGQGAASGVPAMPAAGSGPSAADRALDAAAAKRELDKLITTLLAADDNDVDLARASIAKLAELLPRFTSSVDSTWTYIRMVTAHGMANDALGACAPLRNARRLATTAAQQQAIKDLIATDFYTCAP